eukprot:611276-Pleurochrysis_carterae.AAC.1
MEPLLEKLRTRVIQLDVAQNLENGITIKEVPASIRAMCKNKTPGSDGLTAEFYQTFESLTALLLHKVFMEMTKCKSLMKNMRRGDITLRYKLKGSTLGLRNYRAITLLNLDFKIYSKISVS